MSIKPMKKIKNIKQLKELTKDKAQDFRLALKYGLYSRKSILYEENKDLFYVNNWIDDSYQYLTSKELNDKNKTNIGKAIKVGALYLEE